MQGSKIQSHRVIPLLVFVRKMRDENKDQWKGFCPKSNIFWLHYLSDKLTSGEVKYTNKRSKAHKAALQEIEQHKKSLLKNSSAMEFVRQLT